jgi:tripartite ATP-independent transporter DctP family solute receptor
MSLRTLAKAAATGLFALTIGAAAQAQTVLKFAHADQQNSVRHAGVTMFAKKVEELSQGKVKVQVYCCGQLGSDPKVIEQLVLGGIDMTLSSTGSFAPYIPTLNLTMLPFAFDNFEQGWKFYDESPWLKQQFAKAPAKGFRVLATWEAGFRNMTTRDPLNGPNDANEMMRWSLESMGFGVQIMPLPEVYMAIQQGVVAGQENPIDMINGQKFYEVAPYVTLTNHVYSPTPIVIAEKTWQKLSPADQQVLVRAAAEVTPFMRKTIRESDAKLLADMAAKGAKINRSPDIAAFRQSVEPVYAKAREKYGADADTVLREAETIRKTVK